MKSTVGDGAELTCHGRAERGHHRRRRGRNASSDQALNSSAHREEHEKSRIPSLVVVFGVNDDTDADARSSLRYLEGLDLDVCLPGELSPQRVIDAANPGTGEHSGENGRSIGDSHDPRLAGARQPPVRDASGKRQRVRKSRGH